MDMHYRETLGAAYTEVMGEPEVASFGQGRGGGATRGRGGRGDRRGQGRPGPGGQPGGGLQARMVGDQVGKLPTRYTMAVSAAGDKICVRFNRGTCTK